MKASHTVISAITLRGVQGDKKMSLATPLNARPIAKSKKKKLFRCPNHGSIQKIKS